MQWLTVNWLFLLVGLGGVIVGAGSVWVYCFRWVSCYRVLWENERNGNASARRRLTALEEERMGFKEKKNG